MDIARFVNRYARILKSLNCDGRYGLALLALCVVLVLPVAGGDALRDALRYERAGLVHGEWWRLLTAHFVHLDLEHALLNATGAVLLWCLFARELSAVLWLVAAAVTILVIDTGFWFLQPQLQWYVGASGLLHGLLVAGAIAMLRRGDSLGWVVVLPFAGKLAWEQLHGPLPFESTGTVVTIAHLYGATGGALATLLSSLVRVRAAARDLPL